MSFLNLRIRGRLYGGFGVLLLFCAGLAGFAVWQLRGIATQVASMTTQSRNSIRVGEITTELQKFVDAAEKTDFSHEAGPLETKVLLVRVANWRMLATFDYKGITTFRSNLEKAQQHIAALEKAELPPNLAALLKK